MNNDNGESTDGEFRFGGSQLDEWLETLSSKKSSTRLIGLDRILNFFLFSSDIDSTTNILEGYTDSLANQCTRMLNSTLGNCNGALSKKSTAFATLICLLYGPVEDGRKFYSQVESALLKQLRPLCLQSEKEMFTIDQEDLIIVYLQHLCISLVSVSCNSISSKSRRSLLALCELFVIESTIVDDVRVTTDKVKSKLNTKTQQDTFEDNCSWTLSSDDDSTDGAGETVDDKAIDEESGPDGIKLPDCFVSLRMRAAAADIWCVLTYQQRSLEQARLDSLTADEDMARFERASEVFSSCVESLLVEELEAASSGPAVHLCREGRLSVLRSAFRSLGYLLELGRDCFLQSNGLFGAFQASDLQQLRTFLFDYTKYSRTAA